MKKKLTAFSLLWLGIFSTNAQTNCQNAPLVTAGTHAVTFVNGSQVPLPVCTNGQNQAPDMGAWFKYIPSQTGTAIVSTVLSGQDTRVHIYSGSCTNLICVGGDDDSGANYTSVASFTATAGVTYYIAFDNNWTSTNFNFTLSESDVIAPSFAQQTVNIQGSYSKCVVDLNGDYLDDIVSVSDNMVHVLYQSSSTPGQFTAASLPATATSFMPTWSIAAGDFDKNGLNDLLYGAFGGATIMLADSNGNGFTNKIDTPEFIFSQRTNFVDFNNDGHLDAFVCHDIAPNVCFVNNGAGGFEYITEGMGNYPSGGNYGSIWVDYDNDGDMDLFIAKCRGGEDQAALDELHRNNGDGTFTNIATASDFADLHQSWSAAWADYDNDGDMDVLIGGNSGGGGHKLMRNNGNGTFTNVTQNSGYDIFGAMSREHVTHDFNNDGFADVFGGGSTIMYGNGDLTFTPVTVPMTNGPVGDLNNDGFLDILNFNKVFFNAPNGNNWIRVNLNGMQSNKNGIGARVEIYGAWGKQIRDVRSGDGFEFMSSLNTHFGIGTATAIEKLVIKWPSGVVDTIMNPDINQPLTVTEGSAVLNSKEFTVNGMTLSPNPATDFINVTTYNSLQVKNARIYDFNGRLIKSTAVQNNAVPVQGIARGIYLLIVQYTNGKHASNKFIKG